MSEALETIEQRLDKIEQMLTPAPDLVWTLADVARAARVSETTVRRMMNNDPMAPEPMAASTNNQGQKLAARYLKSSILEWFEHMDRLGQSSKSAKASASAR